MPDANDEELEKLARESLGKIVNAGQFPRLTREVLDSIPDDDLDHTLFSFVEKQKIGESHESGFEIVSTLSPGLRMAYSTWLIDIEVCNGGFHQFFWNADPRFAELAREGFSLIGERELAELLDRVIQVHRAEAPKMRPFHQEGTTKAFAESYSHTSLSQFNEQYWQRRDGAKAARTRFTRSHPSLFVDM